MSGLRFTGSERYGLGMFLALVLMVALGFLFGCASSGDQSTLGDGQVDQVEAATIRVAVGMAFTARPDTVAPAYVASTAILALLDKDAGETALATAIDEAFEAKMDELNLDAATRQSMLDLALLIKAKTMEQIGDSGIAPSEKKVVVREVVAIVQETAVSRMGVGQ